VNADRITMIEAPVALAVEIADEASRLLIETRALEVPTNYGCPVYMVTHLDPHEAGPAEFHDSNLADLARAARYLELRGLLKRPLPSQPDCVTFGGL
jgi:hypothetical protein